MTLSKTRVIIDELKQSLNHNLIQSLYNRSINQLLADHIKEVDLKNTAYEFIASKGELAEFNKFCTHCCKARLKRG
jgi:predicted transcriptional regulator